MGDVPSALLAFSKKDEVKEYCRGLIKDIGKGGGFILSSGCSIPPTQKPKTLKPGRGGRRVGKVLINIRIPRRLK